MLARESSVKYNYLILIQGNVGRVKKLGVVIGENRPSLGKQQLSTIAILQDNSLLHDSPFSQSPDLNRIPIVWKGV